MKLVILDGKQVSQNDIGWDDFSEFGELEIYDRTEPEKVIERIGDAECILVNKVVVDRTIIENTRLKYIGLFSTGYNVIDVVAAREHNVLVCNVPTYSSYAVAQFTFALLLQLCHSVSEHSREVHNGAWISSPDFCFLKFPQVELFNKELGIIGMGKIGMLVATIAQAMGMRVNAFSRSRKELSNCTFVDLDELLHKSDVISIHCPLTPQTQGLIDARAISKMKQGVLLINTARGAILNEHDVAEALEAGKIAGLAVDVLEEEPMSRNCPLFKRKNCIITPHIAWLPRETRLRLLKTVRENLRLFLNGTPQNIVS